MIDGGTPVRRARSPRDPLWSRDYVLAIATNLFVAIVFYELMTTTALYAVDRFAASGTEAGLTSGAFVIGAVVGRLAIGKWIDLLGRKRVLLVSLGLSIVLPLLSGVVAPLWVLVAVRALHGAAFAGATSAVTTGAMALLPASRRGEGAGYYGLSTVVGSAIGPALGVWLIGEFGYPALFAASAVCGVVGLVVGLALRIPERLPTDEDRRAARSWRPSTLVDGSVLPIASVIFLAGMAFSVVLAFLNNYARDEGVAETGGTFFLIYAGTVLLVRLVIGRIQDARGDNVVVVPLLLALGAGLAVLAISPTGVPLVISGVLVGLGFGGLFSAIQAATVTAARPERVGLAISTFLLMADAGIGLGPLVAGALLPLAGFRGTFLVFAALGAAGLVLYLLVHGRTAGRTRRLG